MSRATETADIFEKELELNAGDVAIVFGIDAQAEGLSAGKVGLWEGIRTMILRQIMEAHPQTNLSPCRGRHEGSPGHNAER